MLVEVSQFLLFEKDKLFLESPDARLFSPRISFRMFCRSLESWLASTPLTKRRVTRYYWRYRNDQREIVVRNTYTYHKSSRVYVIQTYRTILTIVMAHQSASRMSLRPTLNHVAGRIESYIMDQIVDYHGTRRLQRISSSTTSRILSRAKLCHWAHEVP